MNQNNNNYKWYREGMESYQRKKTGSFLLLQKQRLVKKLL